MLHTKLLKKNLEQEVADLVDGVTKISVFENQAHQLQKLKILEN